MCMCDSCGEEIVVPVDISGDAHEDHVEDCPVCCHPMTLHIDIDTGRRSPLRPLVNPPVASSRSALARPAFSRCASRPG